MEKWSIDRLKPKYNHEVFKRGRGIGEDDYMPAILIDPNGNVLDGHQYYFSAIKGGRKMVLVEVENFERVATDHIYTFIINKLYNGDVKLSRDDAVRIATKCRKVTKRMLNAVRRRDELKKFPLLIQYGDNHKFEVIKTITHMPAGRPFKIVETEISIR